MTEFIHLNIYHSDLKRQTFEDAEEWYFNTYNRECDSDLLKITTEEEAKEYAGNWYKNNPNLQSNVSRIVKGVYSKCLGKDIEELPDITKDLQYHLAIACIEWKYVNEIVLHWKFLRKSCEVKRPNNKSRHLRLV